MANPFVYVELNTTDVSPSKAFYSKLFYWKLEECSRDGHGLHLHQDRR